MINDDNDDDGNLIEFFFIQATATNFRIITLSIVVYSHSFYQEVVEILQLLGYWSCNIYILNSTFLK